MDEKGFWEFLKEGKQAPKGLSEKTIRSSIHMVREFERFLRRKGPARQLSDAKARDVRAFITHLAKEGRATFDNLIGLLRYACYSRNKDATLALLMIPDGSSIPGLLNDAIEEKHGKRKRDEILGDVKQPPIGTSLKLLPRKTKEFMNRLESGLGEEAAMAVLLMGPHAGPSEYYVEEDAQVVRGRRRVPAQTAGAAL